MGIFQSYCDYMSENHKDTLHIESIQQLKNKNPDLVNAFEHILKDANIITDTDEWNGNLPIKADEAAENYAEQRELKSLSYLGIG